MIFLTFETLSYLFTKIHFCYSIRATRINSNFSFPSRIHSKYIFFLITFTQFQNSTSWSRYNKHCFLCLRLLIDSLLHFQQIFMCHEMILTHFLIIQKFLFYSVIHLLDISIEAILLFDHVLYLRFHLDYLLLVD